MPEFLHRHHDDASLSIADPFIFPHVSRHFSEKEVGHVFPVGAKNLGFVGDVCAETILRAINDQRTVVIADGQTDDAVLLQRTQEGVLAVNNIADPSQQGVAIQTKNFGMKPSIRTSFEENGQFVLTFGENEDAIDHDSLIAASPREPLIIFSGIITAHTEKRYEYQGGLQLQGTVSKQDHGRFDAVTQLIEETEKCKQQGKPRGTYFERWRDSGDILLYKEFHNPKAVIVTEETYPAIVDRKVILLSLDTWYFRRH